MKYEQALKVGRARAEQAAEVIRRWTGVKAIAVCAVKPASGPNMRTTGNWEPVGQQSHKDIARDDGMQGQGNYHLLIVDKSGTAKACTLDRFPLAKVLKLAGRLPLQVDSPWQGELWKYLNQEQCKLVV